MLLAFVFGVSLSTPYEISAIGDSYRIFLKEHLLLYNNISTIGNIFLLTEKFMCIILFHI